MHNAEFRQTSLGQPDPPFFLLPLSLPTANFHARGSFPPLLGWSGHLQSNDILNSHVHRPDSIPMTSLRQDPAFTMTNTLHEADLRLILEGPAPDVDRNLADLAERKDEKDVLRSPITNKPFFQIGVLLLATVELDHAHLSKATKDRQQNLGDIISSKTTEDVRLVAGAIVRCATVNGAPVDSFHTSPGINLSIDKFPGPADSQFLANCSSATDILWAPHVTVDNEVLRLKGGNLAIFVEQTCLKIATPPTSDPLRFIDLRFCHVVNANVELASLQGQDRLATHPKLDLILNQSDKNITVDAVSRKAQRLIIWFEDMDTAKELHKTIRQVLSTPTQVETGNMPSTTAQSKILMYSKVAKNKQPVNVSQNISSPVRSVKTTTQPQTHVENVSLGDAGNAASKVKLSARMKAENFHGSRQTASQALPQQIKTVHARTGAVDDDRVQGKSLFKGQEKLSGNSEADPQCKSGGASTPTTVSDVTSSTSRRIKKIKTRPVQQKKLPIVSSNSADISFITLKSPHVDTGKGATVEEPQENTYTIVAQEHQAGLSGGVIDVQRNPSNQTSLKKHPPVSFQRPVLKSTASETSNAHEDCSISKMSYDHRCAHGDEHETFLPDQSSRKTSLNAFSSTGPANQGSKTEQPEAYQHTEDLEPRVHSVNELTHNRPSTKRTTSTPVPMVTKRARYDEDNQTDDLYSAYDSIYQGSLPELNRATCSQLSTRVDMNGSPYPRAKCLPVCSRSPIESNTGVISRIEPIPINMVSSLAKSSIKSRVLELSSTSDDDITETSTKPSRGVTSNDDLNIKSTGITHPCPLRSSRFLSSSETSVQSETKQQIADVVDQFKNLATDNLLSRSLKNDNAELQKDSTIPRVLTFQQRLRGRMPAQVEMEDAAEWGEAEETFVEEHNSVRSSSLTGGQSKYVAAWFPIDKDSVAAAETSDGTSAAESDTDTEDNTTTESERLSEEQNLNNHHHFLKSQLFLISQRLVLLIASQEDAVNFFINQYSNNAEQLIADLMRSHADDFDITAAKLALQRLGLATQLDQQSQKLQERLINFQQLAADLDIGLSFRGKVAKHQHVSHSVVKQTLPGPCCRMFPGGSDMVMVVASRLFSWPDSDRVLAALL
ncbi:hypothetical protein FH972_020958 [Carpinus fangiana]|uniref:Uncharacterized protein n=1 Tax=Carpinus fangiana TaxID=176857 RepID=A0A5N6KQ11_9ROSI|nr:hypothetical protein FH972_020958 [Carpinus fangiana]